MTTITVAQLPPNARAYIECPSSLDIKDAPADMRTSGSKIKVAPRLCKLISPKGEKLSQYASGREFVFSRHEVETLPKLYELLQVCSRHDRVIVMGVATGEWLEHPKAAYRRLSIGKHGLWKHEDGRDVPCVIDMPPSRLLTIDIDGCKENQPLPDFDPLNPIPAINAHVLPLLGEAFTDCGYIANLTAGTTLDPEQFPRIRLWFLMKNELSEQGRKNLLINLAATTPDLAIDPSSVKAAQVNYTASPIVVPELTFDTLRDPLAYAQEDILPRRWFMVEGNPLDVAEPHVVERGVSSSGNQDFNLYAVNEELNALETPGDEIHSKILTCTYNLARNHGTGLSTENAVAMIKRRLVELSQPGEPLHSRADRINGADLEHEITSAYTGALDMSGCLRPLHVIDDEDEGSTTLSEAAMLLKDTLKDALSNRSHKVHVIKSSCGLGKTRTMLETIKEDGGVCHFYVPDHNKAAELVRDARAAGIETVHIKGKTGLDDDDNPLCMKREALLEHPGSEEFQHIGGVMVCKNWRSGGFNASSFDEEDGKGGESYCPHYNECGYNAQFKQQAQLYVFAHANLTHTSKLGLKRPDFVVIDEDPIPALTKTRRYRLETLKRWRFISTRRVINRLCRALFEGKDLLQAFYECAEEYRKEHGLDGEQGPEIGLDGELYESEDEAMDLDEVAEMLLNRLRGQAYAALREDAGNLDPSMTPEETLRRVSKERISAPWVDLFDLLQKALQNDESTLPGVYKLHDGSILVGSIKAPTAPMGKKVILLDATPNVIALRSIYGDRFRLVGFSVKENLFEIQIAARGFGKTAMVKKVEGETAGHDNRVNDIHAFVRMVSQRDNGAVISYKNVVSQAPLRFGSYELTALHYGALRGQNVMEGKTVLALVGRVLIGSDAAEQGASIVFDDTLISEEETRYVSADAFHKVREGEGKARLTLQKNGKQVHPDARVDAFKDQKMLAEYEQSRGRLRAVRAEETKLLLNFNSFPTGQTVDRLYWKPDQLLGPWRLCELLERHNFYLPLRPSYLAKTFPDVFKTYASAKLFVADVRDWMRGECLFFRLVYEQDYCETTTAPWRQGSRGRVKDPGELLCIRTWEEVRNDPDRETPCPTAPLGWEETTDPDVLLGTGIRKTAFAPLGCAA
ncbi:MAG: hypothetical protein FGM35_02515 [Rhodocyclaceae bacterium]|nr:hypothetical protein [Rhodocyclaceae bacterium]